MDENGEQKKKKKKRKKKNKKKAADEEEPIKVEDHEKEIKELGLLEQEDTQDGCNHLFNDEFYKDDEFYREKEEEYMQ